MNHQILQPVITRLQKDGATENQIADTVADIIHIATTTFYAKAMEAFSEEDIILIEKCITDQEAAALIQNLYKKRIGKNPEDEIIFFLETFVTDYIKERAKE